MRYIGNQKITIGIRVVVLTNFETGYLNLSWIKKTGKSLSPAGRGFPHLDAFGKRGFYWILGYFDKHPPVAPICCLIGDYQ